MKNRTLIIIFLITCILLTITMVIKTTHSLITDITTNNINETINSITIHDLLIDREGVYKGEFNSIINVLEITYDEANIIINSEKLNQLLTEILNNSYAYHYENKPKFTNRYIYNKIVAAVNRDVNINNELKNKVISKSEEFIDNIVTYLYDLEIIKDMNKQVEIIISLSYNINCMRGAKEVKKNINRIGILVLLVLFALFYIITIYFLEKRGISKEEIKKGDITEQSDKLDDEIAIVSNLYKDARILYDVVNNKFTVDSDDTITMSNIVYKKITNFDTVMNNLFTEHGITKYVSDLGNYFAYTEGAHYLAGNLVSYQTYYFRGDDTNIYITSSTENVINAIIYEKWTSNNRNTLATIKVIRENENWLIDEIDILSSE